MRLYRKSDADLLAAVTEERDRLATENTALSSKLEESNGLVSTLIEERDRLEVELKHERERRISVEGAVSMWQQAAMNATERAKFLETELAKQISASNETINKLLAGTVESNAPINWSERREQVKISPAPPRSVMSTMKERAIKGALAAQNPKKPDVVQ